MIKIYDTKQRAKVDFETLEHGKVKMYVCGPTVYNYIHIGNARTFISFDVIRRYFEWRKFDVVFVQNVTDVDDKIIAKANEEGRSAHEVAAEYTKAFIDDMHAVNVKDPTIRPCATQEIPDMIKLVQELVDSGHAYEAGGDVYFDVRSFPQYGELSGRNVDEMESGHRELRTEGIADRKHDPLDFAVWKAAKPGEPAWDSPWGKGRPGWHLECSTMAQKYLGLPFDIHGGGADLVFPHHENECAQSEAATGRVFANHWMHSGMLRINSEKMSKSLGNFLLLRDVLKTVDPNVLRFLMLQTHYRSPLDFSSDRLSEAETALGRIVTFVRNLDWGIENAAGLQDVFDPAIVKDECRKEKIAFITAMDDDFNTSKALGTIFDFIGKKNAEIGGSALSVRDVASAQEIRDLIMELMGVFGLQMDKLVAGDEPQESDAFPPEIVTLAAEVAGYEGSDGAEAVDALLAARAEARAAKDWAQADAIRDRLGALGFAVEDTPQGARISRVED